MGKKGTIEILKQIATKFGGELLSNEYVTTHTKYQWKCKDGHIFERAASKILNQNSFCPIDKGEKISTTKTKERRNNSDILNILASKQDGQCLSEIYINAAYKYQWKCFLGHEWIASYSNIKKGSWCPKCKESKGEARIRKFLVSRCVPFEREKRFANCKGKRNTLPFDFWLPTFGILIEFDGIQHFKPSTGLWKNVSLENIQKADLVKTEYCAVNNIPLIRIRYNQINDVEDILEERLC